MLLKYLFVIALIILFVPSVRRFVFYLLVGRKLVNEQKQQNMRSQRQEGDIRVDRKPNQNSGQRYSDGEYIDYEEVK